MNTTVWKAYVLRPVMQTAHTAMNMTCVPPLKSSHCTGGREYWPMNEIRQVSRKAGEHNTEDEGGGGTEEASLTARKRRQWTLLRFGAAHQHSGETAVPNSTVWLGMLVFWCDLLLAHVPAGGYFLPSHLQR